MKFIHLEYKSVGAGVEYHAHRNIHELDCYYYGKGMHREDGEDYPIGTPSLFYCRPDIPHRMYTDGSKIRFYQVHFTVNKQERLLLEEMAPRLRQGIQVDNEMVTIFSGLERRISSEDPHQKQAAEMYLSGMLHDLYARLHGADKPELNVRVEQAKLLLKQGLDRDLDMDSLAAELFLEKSYMIRLFKRYTGTTPVQYLLTLKIESAKWLLRNTDRQIRDIAEQLRFTNEFYFSRVFKRFTGLSPREFRASPSPVLT